MEGKLVRVALSFVLVVGAVALAVLGFLGGGDGNMMLEAVVFLIFALGVRVIELVGEGEAR
ncbi:hypothetical protein [Thermococcus nautili]|uniref:hypothetical protein n=1 Tax=Thermococcus nautili TaxID=195522 RepID=UPI0025565408|nr:hypothetical protein [Thermococcus nautili]